MCYGRAPYEEFAGSASELHDALKYGTLALTFPEGRSGDMVDLIVQMTRFDRSERPSIDQVRIGVHIPGSTRRNLNCEIGSTAPFVAERLFRVVACP